MIAGYVFVFLKVDQRLSYSQLRIPGFVVHTQQNKFVM